MQGMRTEEAQGVGVDILRPAAWRLQVPEREHPAVNALLPGALREQLLGALGQLFIRINAEDPVTTGSAESHISDLSEIACPGML